MKEICCIDFEHLVFQSNIQQRFVLGKVIISYTVGYNILVYIMLQFVVETFIK